MDQSKALADRPLHIHNPTLAITYAKVSNLASDNASTCTCLAPQSADSLPSPLLLLLLCCCYSIYLPLRLLSEQ